MKKKKIFLMGIVGLLLIILIILIANFRKDNKTLILENNDNEKFRNEYEILNNEKTSDDKEYPKVNISSNNIKYLTIDEALTILDNGTAVIYIGYAECIYCRSAIQVLVDTAKNMDLEYIYYLDVSEIWDEKKLDKDGKIVTAKEANAKYINLLNELGETYTEKYILKNKKGEEIDAKEIRVKVPLVIFVVDGDIVSSNVGTLFSQEDPYTPLDKDQVLGLSEIYSYGIRDVINGLKNNN